MAGSLEGRKALITGASHVSVNEVLVRPTGQSR
jgi:hypothetical protein